MITKKITNKDLISTYSLIATILFTFMFMGTLSAQNEQFIIQKGFCEGEMSNITFIGDYDFTYSEAYYQLVVLYYQEDDGTWEPLQAYGGLPSKHVINGEPSYDFVNYPGIQFQWVIEYFEYGNKSANRKYPFQYVTEDCSEPEPCEDNVYMVEINGEWVAIGADTSICQTLPFTIDLGCQNITAEWFCDSDNYFKVDALCQDTCNVTVYDTTRIEVIDTNWVESELPPITVYEDKSYTLSIFDSCGYKQELTVDDDMALEVPCRVEEVTKPLIVTFKDCDGNITRDTIEENTDYDVQCIEKEKIVYAYSHTIDTVYLPQDTIRETIVITKKVFDTEKVDSLQAIIDAFETPETCCEEYADLLLENEELNTLLDDCGDTIINNITLDYSDVEVSDDLCAISISPNPVKEREQFTITTYGTSEPIEYRIYTQYGEEVSSGDIDNNIAVYETLSNKGLYVVSVKLGENSYKAAKLIVQ